MRRQYPVTEDSPLAQWNSRQAYKTSSPQQTMSSKRWCRQFRGPVFKLVLLILLAYLGYTVYHTVSGRVSRVEKSVLSEGIQKNSKLQGPPLGRGHKVPGRPPLVLLLTYQSVGGADNFGQLFNRSPDVAYVFEPLDALYSAMFGTEEGRNLPKDIFTWKTGEERKISDVEARTVAEYLRNIMACDFAAVPTEFLVHHFWEIHSSEDHSSLKDYVKCLQTYQLTATRDICRRTHLEDKCSARFGEDRRGSEECLRNLWDVDKRVPLSSKNANPPFDKYLSCMEAARQQSLHCQGTLSFVCQVAKKGRVVKSVRADMRSVAAMLDLGMEMENLKVVHLYRDPRAVLLSDAGVKQNTDSLYGNGAVAKEMKLYCRDLLRDISLRRQLEKKYPNTIIGVDFDSFAQDPTKVVQTVFDFVGMNMTSAVRDLSKRPDMVKDIVFDAAGRWQYELSKETVRQVTEDCRNLFLALPVEKIVQEF